jgi:glycine cleavage system H protein
MAGDETWYGCVVPRDLLYDVDKNVWLRFEGDEVVVGMTDVAQTLCGKFVQITWKQPGRTVARGRSLAIVESAKWVGPLPSPLTSEIIANNEAGFAADILAANKDPYGAGWLYRLRPTALDAERGALVDGKRAFELYKAFIDANEIRCFRCAD